MAVCKALGAVLSAAIVLGGCLVAYEANTASTDPITAEGKMEVSDRTAVWEFDDGRDMQLPELPTGCEATAAATLLSMVGVEVGKEQVADAMPKSSRDWVTHFCGDPHAKGGAWNACAAPCAAAAANAFLGGTGLHAEAVKGRALDSLEPPFCAWVTIDLRPAQVAAKLNGWPMTAYSHTVTVTEIAEDTVACVDPLRGCMVYGRAAFEARYKTMGEQAVVIGQA